METHIITYWNGLPTTATRGTAIVADAPEFPEYWARPIIGIRVPVVCVDLDGVNAGGGIIYIDNREGVGWFKVTKGQGSPAYGHGDIAIVPDSFEEESD